MKLGIDWVSMGILLFAYLVSRMPGVPPRVGNAGLAIACGGIGYYRFSHGGLVGLNAVMVGLASAFCLFYLSKVVSGSGNEKKKAPKDDED
jgi:hypothetical protein